MNWNGCAPPPEPQSQERDLDPARNTVPDASGYTIMSIDESGHITHRAAEQSDLRHCASCTCPTAPDVVQPSEVVQP